MRYEDFSGSSKDQEGDVKIVQLRRLRRQGDFGGVRRHSMGQSQEKRIAGLEMDIMHNTPLRLFIGFTKRRLTTAVQEIIIDMPTQSDGDRETFSKPEFYELILTWVSLSVLVLG